ncbi:MAG: nucleotidyltransferase family protein [Caldiserica bacterium]|nr:nucleotidyltransferase family protein [Caldisericota bacterium]
MESLLPFRRKEHPIRKEDAFLLHAISPVKREFPDTGSLDWEYIYQNAFQHRISGIVYNRIKATPSLLHSIPPLYLGKFAGGKRKIVQHNQALLQEFLSLHHGLQKNQVEIIPIKGMPLLKDIFHDLSLRPLSDIDILIREEDYPRVKSFLLHSGYSLLLENRKESYWRKHQCHVKFFRQINSRKILLEVHWTFLPPRPHPVSLSSLWQRLQVTHWEGEKILIPSAEDIFMLTFAHIYLHLRYIPLRIIHDFSWLTLNFKDTYDWEYIWRETMKNRLENILYFSGLLAQELLSIPYFPLKEKFNRENLKTILLRRLPLKELIFPPRSSSLRKNEFILRYLLSGSHGTMLHYLLLPPREEVTRFFALPYPSWKATLAYHLRFFYLPLWAFWQVMKGGENFS